MKKIMDTLEKALDSLNAISKKLDQNLIDLQDCKVALENIGKGHDMIHLQWRKVDGNKLWLRAVMSRHTNPTSFALSLIPERSALITDPEFLQILEWIKKTNFPANYLGEGMIAFSNEEDMSTFLLRWA